jgi:hypothetical protein
MGKVIALLMSLSPTEVDHIRRWAISWLVVTTGTGTWPIHINHGGNSWRASGSGRGTGAGGLLNHDWPLHHDGRRRLVSGLLGISHWLGSH